MKNSQYTGDLWKIYLISKRKKKNLNENTNKNLYFWWTYDEQEIDLIEVVGNELAAFEIKWGNKTPNVPNAFATAYPQATYKVINQNNYLDFIL